MTCLIHSHLIELSEGTNYKRYGTTQGPGAHFALSSVDAQRLRMREVASQIWRVLVPIVPRTLSLVCVPPRCVRLLASYLLGLTT